MLRSFSHAHLSEKISQKKSYDLCPYPTSVSAFEYAWSLLKALPEQQYYGHPFANLDSELFMMNKFWGDHPKNYWRAGEGGSYGTMHPVIQRLVREGA